MTDSNIPARLGKYRIDGILGEGSMGLVYRGYDPALDRRVAVKTMRKDMAAGPAGAEMLERFRREANAGIRLSHKHVVTVYELGEDSQQAFMAMEFIDGQSLRDLNAQRAPWPLLEALELAHQLLEALDFFHVRGVVHRDIKPANIMIDEAGKLLVTDFGIARTEASDLTQVGTILGTPSYMSPEQITGQPIDGRSDLFSVGVILYEMLTASKPFRGEMITIAHNIVCEPHPEPSTLNGMLPPAIDRLFQRALAKKPEDRFCNGAEFREALEDMLAAVLQGGAEPASAAGCTIRQASSEMPAAASPSLAVPGAAPSAPGGGASPDEASTPRRQSFKRCPKCGVTFDAPRPWNAICSGCGVALFEAAEHARSPLSGKRAGRRGISPGWVVLVALVFFAVLVFVLRGR